MELNVTLKDEKSLNKYLNAGVDGVIFGSKFSLRFKYDEECFLNILKLIKEHNVKAYVCIDAFIKEDELQELFEYVRWLKELGIDGIYFNDLAVLNAARILGIEDKLILDNNTLMSNVVDIKYYLHQNLDSVVIARELVLEEVAYILEKLKDKISMQIFGHLRMSYSKRAFLSNYFKYIDKDFDVNDKKTLKIVETQRDYAMPIVEDEFGTRIYTDYIFEMYESLPVLMPYLKRGIIEDGFIEDECVAQVIKDLKRITSENYHFLRSNLLSSFPKYNFSSGYLFEKTNLRKETDE